MVLAVNLAAAVTVFDDLARELDAGKTLDAAGMMLLDLDEKFVIFLSMTAAFHTYAGFTRWRASVVLLRNHDAALR